MNRSTTSVCLLLALLPASTLAQSDAACAAMANANVPGIDLQITSAGYHTAREARSGAAGIGTLPPHCHLEGEIDRRTGSDGRSYALRFAINLPDAWNGRYLFQGGGGLNGVLNEPLGVQASGGVSALSRGFAVVSTDSGHQAQRPFDSSFMADQEAALNFYFLGNMRVTRATRPLVEQYYNGGIQHAYFVGCSTGGREGMIMAQRFPYLFDGIVSGAPAMRTGYSNLALRWINVSLNQAAEDAQQDGAIFSREEQETIIDGLLESCDALDGIEDGLVFDVPGCGFEPRSLACEAGESGNCLAPEKAEALSRALAGPVDSRGVPVYSPFVLDTGLDDRGGLPGLLVAGGSPPEGPSSAGRTSQDVDAEVNLASALDQSIGNPLSFNLSSFIANGGKQIFYHGVSDPWFSAMDTVWYYERMAETNAQLRPVDDYSRLFLVPGMGHCAGGERTLDRFDMLDAIVEWVESDNAPETVTATGDSMPEVARPLCPYPTHPHYDGSGDSNDPANFSCRE